MMQFKGSDLQIGLPSPSPSEQRASPSSLEEDVCKKEAKSLLSLSTEQPASSEAREIFFQ